MSDNAVRWYVRGVEGANGGFPRLMSACVDVDNEAFPRSVLLVALEEADLWSVLYDDEIWEIQREYCHPVRYRVVNNQLVAIGTPTTEGGKKVEKIIYTVSLEANADGDAHTGAGCYVGMRVRLRPTASPEKIVNKALRKAGSCFGMIVGEVWSITPEGGDPQRYKTVRTDAGDEDGEPRLEPVEKVLGNVTAASDSKKPFMVTCTVTCGNAYGAPGWTRIVTAPADAAPEDLAFQALRERGSQEFLIDGERWTITPLDRDSQHYRVERDTGALRLVPMSTGADVEDVLNAIRDACEATGYSVSEVLDGVYGEPYGISNTSLIDRLNEYNGRNA